MKGNQLQYYGEFKQGKRHRSGICWYEGGRVYEGDWVNGKRYGKGRMLEQTGDLYEG